MKNLAILISCAAVSGCFVDVLTTTAIQGELAAQSASAGRDALDYTSDSTARLEIEQAVRAWRAETGSNPPSLQALVPEYLARIPVDRQGNPYHYDPATGAISSGPAAPAQPGAITGQDRQSMQRIHAAIYKYWETTRYYPPSLNSLVPDYLPSLPRTSAGRPFVYDAQTGTLHHPADLAPAPARAATPVNRQGAGVGGAGLLGESLTGIGIQQELNSRPSGAGGRTSPRSQARDVAGQQSDRQMRALRNLDLN